MARRTGEDRPLKRTYTIRDVPFRLIFTKALPKDYYGLIKWKTKDYKDGGVIRIRKDMPLNREIDTVIHEVLHAAYPDLEEDAVYDGANAISYILMDLYDLTPKTGAKR